MVPPANEEEAGIDGCFSKGTFSSKKNSPGGIKVKFFLLVEFQKEEQKPQNHEGELTEGGFQAAL